jgi:LacI family transcriptional regulator
MTTTIDDIARDTNLSSATISRVLNSSGYVKKETREKVVKSMEKLNYAPSAIARSLSMMETNIIGVVVPDINNPFFSEVIKGISSLADTHNLNIFLCDTDENHQGKELRQLRLLKEQRIRGLIITPTSENDENTARYLFEMEKFGIPVVLIDRDVKGSSLDGVFVDNTGGAFAATNVLIKEGHDRIAIITGPITSLPGRGRLEGYQKAFRSNGYQIDEELILQGDFMFESGYYLTQKILSMQERPTAIFCSNNLMTLGCMKALHEACLKIPQDISIISFDEIEVFNILGLNISYVARPTKEMGWEAMRILLSKMDLENTDTTQSRVILPTNLVLMGSEKRMA